jgi:hypothetical protein
MNLKIKLSVTGLVVLTFVMTTYLSFSKVSDAQTDPTLRTIATPPQSFVLRLDDSNYDECSERFDSELYNPLTEEAALLARENCRAQNSLIKASAEGVQYPYLSEMSSVLSPQLEARFDVFLVINTDNKVNERPEAKDHNVNVPSQHVRVIVKKNKGTDNLQDNVFLRDFLGNIVGLDESKIDNNVIELEGLNIYPDDIPHAKNSENIPYLIPSTTGSINYMKTVNGLYLVNIARSINNLNTSPQAGMSHQTYIDTRYRSGKESGIAIHGTPSRNRKYLGEKRASHGCARVHPTHAQIIRNYVLSLPQRSVPNLKWKSWLSFDAQNSVVQDFVNSVPVMFVIFNGYDPAYNSFTDIHKPVPNEPQKGFAQF